VSKAPVVLAALTLLSARASAAPCRALAYTFSPDCMRAPGQSACAFDAARPDLGPQIAVWVESADRSRFVDTLMVTNATALFGIGNRPGLAELRSGPKFPYGRRPMSLPIWAYARGTIYPTVVMQDGEEGYLTGHEGDSSPEPHFCRPMLPSEVVDAITCPSGFFRSDKGKLDETQLTVYPPRADLLDFGQVCPTLPNRPNGSCNPGDSAAYAFLNDVDTIAAATPPFAASAGGTWVVPEALPAGDYALMVEVSKEFDSNATYDAPNAPSLDFDVFGTAGNLGQPSVVYRVPFTLDAAGTAQTATAAAIYGYGDWTGAAGTIFPPDGSLSSDPGSGEARLAMIDGPPGAGRVQLALSACVPVDCTSQGPPPAVPIEIVTGTVTATSATVRIRQVADGDINGAGNDNGRAPVLGYDVRSALVDIQGPANLDTSAFARWTPSAPVVPAAPDTTTDTIIAGLVPDSDYAVGVVARGHCGSSPVSYARFHTPRPTFEQLHGCFVATAAFGSNMAAEVATLRRLRDRAEEASGLARIAADLYYRAAPAAARPLALSPTARAIVRLPLRPLAAAAGALLSSGAGPLHAAPPR
jgi:hypothetical protein